MTRLCEAPRGRRRHGLLCLRTPFWRSAEIRSQPCCLPPFPRLRKSRQGVRLCCHEKAAASATQRLCRRRLCTGWDAEHMDRHLAPAESHKKKEARLHALRAARFSLPPRLPPSSRRGGLGPGACAERRGRNGGGGASAKRPAYARDADVCSLPKRRHPFVSLGTTGAVPRCKVRHDWLRPRPCPRRPAPGARRATTGHEWSSWPSRWRRGPGYTASAPAAALAGTPEGGHLLQPSLFRSAPPKAG